jgi:ketosteroid isomerase-like protein
MSTSANLSLVRSICASWARGDFSSSEWAHPEIELVLSGEGPTSGSWTGWEGMAQGWRDWLSAWEDVRVEADEYRELEGERVLVLTHYSGGSGKASGLELGQIHGAGVAPFHIRDGKVTRLVLYVDRERALADVGLAPQDGSG